MRDELNSRPSEEMETIDHLANVLSYFQSIVSTTSSSSSSSPNDNDEAEICDNHNNHHHRQQKEKEVPCVARIVSTIGKSGTKCPRWHADHVPVRLVMSLRGPGCEYVQEESVGVGVCGGGDGKGRIGSTGGSNNRYHESEVMVNRHALNNLDEEDTTKANNVIVKTSVPTTRSSSLPSTSTSSTLIKHAKDGSCCDDGEHGNKLIAKMMHAKEGDAVLLMGKGWEEGAELNDDAINEEQLTVHDRHDGIDCCHDNAILAAVHRSPKLKPNQERILLTIDLA
ncbi:hypothetical protein ACHAWU_005647 [Discostella pseudostelligera]|uniref:Uncharacterized protein n=1 Tax=Discostella pseudostelligera TaxID=259834 RepID=A0ABD3LZX8_9STRA